MNSSPSTTTCAVSDPHMPVDYTINHRHFQPSAALHARHQAVHTSSFPQLTLCTKPDFMHFCQFFSNSG